MVMMLEFHKCITFGTRGEDRENSRVADKVRYQANVTHSSNALRNQSEQIRKQNSRKIDRKTRHSHGNKQYVEHEQAFSARMF